MAAQPTSRLRAVIGGGILGTLLACLAIAVPAFTIYPDLRDLFPEATSLFALTMGLPAFVTGIIIGWRSLSPTSFLAGMIGIALGVFWHLHLAVLAADLANTHVDSGQTLSGFSIVGGFFLRRWIINAEYSFLLIGDIIPGSIMVMLPILCGSSGLWVANRFLTPAR